MKRHIAHTALGIILCSRRVLAIVASAYRVLSSSVVLSGRQSKGVRSFHRAIGENMQSVTRRRIQLFMVFVAIAFPAVTSAAPVPASGTLDDGCQFAPVFSAAGPNTLVTNGVTVNLFGTLLGTYAGTQSGVSHADGRNTFHGSGIFTGAVAGRSGTATFRYEGMFPDEPFHATWVLVGETGSLASVNGHGTFVGTSGDATGACDLAPFSGSYEGALNLGP